MQQSWLLSQQKSRISGMLRQPTAAAAMLPLPLPTRLGTVHALLS
jgi:hypothetical protein